MCLAQATVRSRSSGVPEPSVRRAGPGVPGPGRGAGTGAFRVRGRGGKRGRISGHVGLFRRWRRVPRAGRRGPTWGRFRGRRRAFRRGLAPGGGVPLGRAGCARAGPRGAERGRGRRQRVCPGAIPWRRGGRKAPESCPACEGFFPHTIPGPPFFRPARGFFPGAAAGFSGGGATRSPGRGLFLPI